MVVPVLWIVWSSIVVLMIGLHVYRSSLEKDEEDQIFLDESFDHEKVQQAAIVARVNKVEPLVRVSHWLVAGMSLIVIAYYIRDILMHLNIIQ
ncbi:MAG TPA: hypothetical protein VMA34_01545 [Terracidiphilus sp.]|nr:hypothetical protein [Terracidiphilus sp.]